MSAIETSTPPDPPKQRGQRTRPWSPDEYIVIKRHRLVYSVDEKKAITVHLPGCVATTPEALRRAGHAVVMPAQLRTSDFN